jgi:hypothetical protein
MDDARYHRCQAELCLEIAELMSDPAAAKLLREAATRHLAEATANGSGTFSLSPRGPIPRQQMSSAVVRARATNAVSPPEAACPNRPAPRSTAFPGRVRRPLPGPQSS